MHGGTHLTWTKHSLALLFLLISTHCLFASGNSKKKVICEAKSGIYYNATLKGGLRGKTVQYVGRVENIDKCVEAVCTIDKTDYAFVLKDHCYAVTCLSECEAATGRLKQPTALVEIGRTTYMSEEHRIVSDVFRHLKDKDTRPKTHAKQKMRIRLNVRLVQILDVDAVGQAIKLNVWTTQEWNNPLLVWDDTMYGNVSLVNVEPDLVWTPVVLLYNNADNSMKSVHTMKTKVIINNTGYSTWFASTSLKASCKINVKYFPFDEQICHLNFGSWTNGINELDITPFPLEGGSQHYTENSEWEVVRFTFKKETKKYKCCKYPFAEVAYQLHLRRKTLYYIYTLILPATTITALIAIGFCLPPNSGERIALSITTLVSMTVYLNIASKRLPASSESIPLLSLFYFLLLIQISLSVAASTYVLMFFYRQNFSQPMPGWIKYIIVEQLGKILCGVVPPERPPLKTRRQRKTVRFSDVVTVSGSQSPETMKHSHAATNGHLAEANPEDTGYDHCLLSTTRLIESENESQPDQDLISVNGSAQSTESLTSTAGSVQPNGSIFNFNLINEPDRKHVQKIMISDVDAITSSLHMKEMRQAEMQEWHFASMVVDRAFLILFAFTLIMSVCFLMLHKIPHLIDR